MNGAEFGTDGRPRDPGHKLVLSDPNARWTIRAAEQHSRVDYSLFEGFEVEGRVKKTFLRGNLIVDGDALPGRVGMGEFLKRGESGRL